MSQIFNPDNIRLGNWAVPACADWPSDIEQITTVQDLTSWQRLWDRWDCGCVSSPDRFFTTYEEAVSSLEDDWEEDLSRPYVPCRVSDEEDILLGQTEENTFVDPTGQVSVP